MKYGKIADSRYKAAQKSVMRRNHILSIGGYWRGFEKNPRILSLDEVRDQSGIIGIDSAAIRYHDILGEQHELYAEVYAHHKIDFEARDKLVKALLDQADEDELEITKNEVLTIITHGTTPVVL